MGDAADDAYDQELKQQDMAYRMKAAGCIRCNHCNQPDYVGEFECPICLDLGWIDKDGNPCEP